MSNSENNTEEKQLAIKKDSPLFSDLIQSMQAAEEFAKYVVESDTFGDAFKKPKLDKEGRPIPGEFIKNKSDVIMAMHLGAELGIPPVVAISLGKKLNGKSYLVIEKGKRLGLDAATALQNISIISNANGVETYHTGVHVITKALLDGQCKTTVVEDYKMIRRFTNIDNEQVSNAKVLDKDGDLKDEYFVVYHYQRKTAGKEAFEDAKKKGKILLIELTPDYRTTVRFERPSKQVDLTISYTTQEAIDAKLLRGYHSTELDENGKPLWVKGKNNWNDNPARMLRNRVFSIGGNIAVSDILGGTFEISDMAYDAKISQPAVKAEEFEEARIVTDTDSQSDTK